MSFFEFYKPLPPDPILGLTIAFKEEQRSNKINLGVGAYRDSEGKPHVLESVRRAEAAIVAEGLNKEYQPIDGNPQLRSGLAALLLPNHGPEKIYIAQTAGGTGALSIGANILIQKSNTLYISNPSWPNHRLIFTRAGFHVDTYPYYDAPNSSLDFEAMKKALQTLAQGSIVVLHVCCHNPTGCDPSPEQWRELSALFKRHKLFPFFDFAYHGFAETLEKDAFPVRLFAEEGHEFFCAYSLSKNFGLYGERVGALMIAANSDEAAATMATQVKQAIRATISQTPLHGGRIAAKILNDSDLRKQWENELLEMRHRIASMRSAFANALNQELPHKNWDFIKLQHGLFSFCGLPPELVEKLREKYAIYMPASGRINVAGLTPDNLPYVVDALSHEKNTI